MTQLELPDLSELDLLRSVCQRLFRRFVREFWEQVPGAGVCQWNWHLDVFCEELQTIAIRVFRGEPKQYDLLVNVPFGTSKSTIFSILFPAWVWSFFPKARFILFTHTDKLANDFAWKTRAVLESEKYRELYPSVELERDSSECYSNLQGGEVRSCTVGGKTPTGFHAHFVIGDDPLDPQGARSDAELETVARFLTEVIPSRVVDKKVSTLCLIMQRLHFRDPAAVMLDTGKKDGASPVRHIKLPGEIFYGEDGATLEGQVYPQELASKYVNCLLDPVRMPKEVLRRFEATLGPYGYAGQVLQNPTPPGGGMFKETYFLNRCKAAPYESLRVRYWDRAATAMGGCATAGVLMAKDSGGRYYVEHVVHGQWEPDERNKRILATAQADRLRYGPKYEPRIYVEAERGSTGLEAFRYLARMLDGFPVFEDMPSGRKDVRAEPWSSQCAAMNVWIVEDSNNPWDVNGYVQEHVLFMPDLSSKRLGAWKDRVDASSGAYNLLSGRSVTGGFRVLRLRPRHKTGLRIVACTLEELKTLQIVDESSLLVVLREVNQEETPPHCIAQLQGTLHLTFSALDPAQHQDSWNEDKAKSIMTREHGKKLWAFLTRKRDVSLACWIVAAESSSLALSFSLGISDAYLGKRDIVQCMGDPDCVYKPDFKPPNRHVWEMVKATRSMVVT